MNLAAWAERSGVARVSGYGWFRAGLLAVPAQRVGRLIVVGEPTVVADGWGRTAVCAWVSSADQKADLDRRVAWVTGWASAEQNSGRWGRHRGWVGVERAPRQVFCAAG